MVFMNHLGLGRGISVYLWGPRSALEGELFSNHELQIWGDGFPILIQESPPCPQVKACSGFHRVTPSTDSVNACPWWLESDRSPVFSLTSQSGPTSRTSSGSPHPTVKHIGSPFEATVTVLMGQRPRDSQGELDLLHSCCRLFRTRAADPSVQTRDRKARQAFYRTTPWFLCLEHRGSWNQRPYWPLLALHQPRWPLLAEPKQHSQPYFLVHQL